MPPTPTVTATAVRTLSWLQSIGGLDVPVYQRDYRWGLDSCRRLLADVRSAQSHSHFIGSIITAGRLLVDGQQRITTLFLLLIALREKHPEHDYDSILRTPRGRPRLRTHPEFEPLMAALLDKRTPEHIPPHGAAFLENLNEFHRLLEIDSSGVWEGLNNLENIVVSLGDAADPQQVFESLNSSGEVLKDNELIHNYVLMGLTRNEQEVAEREIWLPIEQHVGRAMERFWRDVLVMAAPALTDLRGTNGHYRHFRSRYPNLDIDELAVVGPTWVALAEIFATLRDPSGHPHERVLKALRDSFPAASPLTLGLLHARAERLLPAVETMLMRRAIVGRDHDLALISSLCRHLDDLGELEREIVRRTPEDAAVAVALRHQAVPLAPAVLARVQHADGPLQVERIAPPVPADDWHAGDGRTWGALSADERGAYRLRTKTIGNLTLIERDLAGKTGKRAFSDKRAVYARSAVASDLANVDLWTPEAIDARTATMIDAVLAAWPSAAEGEDTDSRTRLIDLPPLEPGENLDLDHAIVGSETLGDAHDARSLLDAAMTPLWRDHAAEIRALSDDRGWSLIADRPEQRRQYRPLGDGAWLYLGWSADQQLRALQQIVDALGLADEVRVAERG